MDSSHRRGIGEIFTFVRFVVVVAWIDIPVYMLEWGYR